MTAIVELEHSTILLAKDMRRHRRTMAFPRCLRGDSCLCLDWCLVAFIALHTSETLVEKAESVCDAHYAFAPYLARPLCLQLFADALQAHRLGGSQLLRPEGNEEFLKQPA